MIRDYNDFSKYKYKVSNEDIFSDNLEHGISGIKLNSKTLLILPRTKTIGSINQYNDLSFVEFNNYKLTKTDIGILADNRYNFKRVSCLSFWNTKITDLKLLEFFENVEFLNIAHITDKDFTFEGINNLEKLKTLCLLKTGKVKDFSSIKIKNAIENFSLIQPTNIKDTTGIENLRGLKYLNIEGSEDKTYNLERINGLDKLTSLQKIKLHRINIPFEELIVALNLSLKIELEIDTNLYLT